MPCLSSSPPEAVTVTAQVPDLLPAFTVMTADPIALAVTNPVGDTDATVELEEVHVTDLSVAFDGLTVAVN